MAGPVFIILILVEMVVAYRRGVSYDRTNWSVAFMSVEGAVYLSSLNQPRGQRSTRL